MAGAAARGTPSLSPEDAMRLPFVIGVFSLAVGCVLLFFALSGTGAADGALNAVSRAEAVSATTLMLFAGVAAVSAGGVMALFGNRPLSIRRLRRRLRPMSILLNANDLSETTKSGMPDGPR
ncbi:hypothetical protein RNZ50_14540 [Paracoccaceae bacterium Fryx2]|nr:hypothetical protein [Paracoccaceae bacterium Fryx2]